MAGELRQEGHRVTLGLTDSRPCVGYRRGGSPLLAILSLKRRGQDVVPGDGRPGAVWEESGMPGAAWGCPGVISQLLATSQPKCSAVWML